MPAGHSGSVERELRSTTTTASSASSGASSARSCVSAASGRSYGGSMKTRSNGPRALSRYAATAFCATLTRATWPRARRFRASALRRQMSAAGFARSTSTASAAPRLTASRPRAPEPAYRSSTAAPSMASRDSSAEKIASRTRSLVGRVPERGTCRLRDPAKPAMMRVMLPEAYLRVRTAAMMEAWMTRPTP